MRPSAERVAVLIPTVGNRAAMLANVIAGFHCDAHECGYAVNVATATGYTWGAGCTELAERFGDAADYLLFACDDTVPRPGWFAAARAMLDDGFTPASRYFHPNGEPLNPATDLLPHGTPMTWCRSFLLTPEIFRRVGPMIDATWYADIDYSERLAAAGLPVVACDGFSFTHLESLRDWRTDEVAAAELAAYEASVARREAGALW